MHSIVVLYNGKHQIVFLSRYTFIWTIFLYIGLTMEKLRRAYAGSEIDLYSESNDHIFVKL